MLMSSRDSAIADYYFMGNILNLLIFKVFAENVSGLLLYMCIKEINIYLNTYIKKNKNNSRATPSAVFRI